MPKPKNYVIPGDQIRDLIHLPGGCLATDRIMVDGRQVGYMYRVVVTPDDWPDNGWRFFAGDESDEYLADASNTGVYALNTVANYDQDIIGYLDTPAPCAFEKVPGSRQYKRVQDPDEESA